MRILRLSKSISDFVRPYSSETGRVTYACVEVKLNQFFLFAQLVQGVGLDAAPLVLYISIPVHIAAVLAVVSPSRRTRPLLSLRFSDISAYSFPEKRLIWFLELYFLKDKRAKPLSFRKYTIYL